MNRKVRKLAATVALAGGLVVASATAASAHECYVANRSAQGNAGASHSANWYTLQVAELYGSAHLFLETGVPLSEQQVAEAVALTDAAGIPTSFTVFERFTLPRNTQEFAEVTSGKSTDGKGIDHFFAAYGEQIIGIYFQVAFPGAPA